ncbi:MAG: nucleotidyltransferase family protein, partial [Pseudomonadota bacterium]
MAQQLINTAMVLAAGRGTRIRSLDPHTPKPLIPVNGQPLIDYTLGLLSKGGVERVVVNVHHLADHVESHVTQAAERFGLHLTISDEREQLLETGGGILKALPKLGDQPFFCSNTDAILRPRKSSSVEQLRDRWSEACDALLLMVRPEAVSGYQGTGDFSLAEDGQIIDLDEASPLMFTGLQILRPRLFEGAAIEPVSTRAFWQKARAEGRMHGVVFDGDWMHVGDPEGHRQAEAR